MNTLSSTGLEPVSTSSDLLHRRASDIDEHAHNLSNWQLRYDQLTPGRFDGELTELRCGWMQLVRDRSNQAMIKSGQAWKGAVAFSLPLASHDEVYCAGHIIRTPSLLVAPAEDLPQIRTPGPIDLLCMAVDRQALESMLQRQHSEFRITALPTCYRLQENGLHIELRRLLDDLMGFEAAHSPLKHESIRHALRDAIMLQLLEQVAHDPETLNATARKRMVDRAREYALSHLDQPFSMLDLCNSIGASRRKLQYCFQDALGINPVAYLRAVRLNAVRRELLAGRPGASVQAVAARWGFWHLSRFSGEYRQLFGELPSQTLRRSSCAENG
ncbi:helix-turn-helix domain-containing protein [Pseudomonas syringae]|nr:helix-turn-helix domain-containing protein [Pseudomonas syringae]MBD8573877.1 helix-turn-helix domain-containing protein [Pseudomonas syringae]MBD8790157.1 helix-turn-helix domain-containing protein [Pseudomonas syringae]MBD8803841.1 helix-turn-helix domain-containing protein [Pseudomonas syringae]MBD8814826.1 helix-turn-helix domain-containing protein [Pseudomonas syringae]